MSAQPVRRAVVPGSFDPITLGHLDIITRAAGIFPDVVVAVGRNTTKNYLFDEAERLELVRSAVAGLPGVSVAVIDGLLVDFCTRIGAGAIVKGIRSGSDVDYELPMAQVNHALSGIETLFLPAGRQYGGISATLLREVAMNHGDISAFVPEPVAAAVRRKLGY